MSRARAARKPLLGAEVSKAHVKFARVSARKTRYLADLIRGLTVGEAQRQLLVAHKPSSMPTMSGALNAAIANYEHLRREEQVGDSGPSEDLIVGEIQVNAGPIIKRFQPMPMGRAGSIRKRSCHLIVKLFAQAE